MLFEIRVEDNPLCDVSVNLCKDGDIRFEMTTYRCKVRKVGAPSVAKVRVASGGHASQAAFKHYSKNQSMTKSNDLRIFRRRCQRHFQ